MVGKFLLKRSKAQFALEFSVLIAVMFIIFVGISAVVAEKYLSGKETERKIVTQKVAELAYDEIVLATTVANGYSRSFEIPYRLDGAQYNITVIDDRELVITYFDQEYVLFLPNNVQGNLGVGTNTITKLNGIVYLSN